jgi:hypothetical protein
MMMGLARYTMDDKARLAKDLSRDIIFVHEAKQYVIQSPDKYALPSRFVTMNTSCLAETNARRRSIEGIFFS